MYVFSPGLYKLEHFHPRATEVGFAVDIIHIRWDLGSDISISYKAQIALDITKIAKRIKLNGIA